MKKLLVLLVGVIVLAFPLVGSCQSNQQETKEKNIMVKAEFIELTQNGKKTSQRIFAKPTIAVLNNSHAEISIGQKVPIFTQTLNTSEPTVDYKNAGVYLYVAPQITSDGNISMNVKCNFATIKEYSKDILKNPIFLESESSGELVFKNRESLFIGSPLKVATATSENTSIILVKLTPTIGND